MECYAFVVSVMAIAGWGLVLYACLRPEGPV